MEKLNELGSKGISVKILTIQGHKIGHLKEIRSKYPEIKFKTPHIHFTIKNRITIIDRTKTIILKIKNDARTNIQEAVGSATIIEGESTAWSYTAIFDTLWKQFETVEKLKKINRQLQSDEKIQKEYIDVITHELRSPIQPIIGLTEYVKERIKDKKQIELLDSVIASGQKLNALTESILDISKIEGHSFSLKEQKFNLNELLLNTVKVFEKILKRNKKKIKFDFIDFDKQYMILGDRNRLEQVISNLVHNSIKSISRKYHEMDGGKVSIKLEKKKNRSQIINQARIRKIMSLIFL